MKVALLRRAPLALVVVALALVSATRAAATVITASPVDFSASEQSAFSGAVATFTDDDPNAQPTDFVAVVDWGDGSPSSFGTISENAGTFTVTADHTFDDEGIFSTTVTITEQEPGEGFASVTDTATVSDADVLTGTPLAFSVASGVSFTRTVATFTDTLTSAVPGDFTATIDWGDATVSAGTVSGGGGAFQVSGTHTYAAPGNYSVTVTLSDDPPGTATATVASNAQAVLGLVVTANDFSVPEATTFDGQVATFADSDGSKTAADFTVTVDWGDGSAPTAGVVTGGQGTFTVSGQHVYADEGSFTTTVTVTESGIGGATASDTATASVTESDQLTGAGTTIDAGVSTPFTGTVATFTDTNTSNVAGDFTATIDWGDGNVGAGTVSGGAGTFTVSGTHVYTAPGTFPVVVTLTEDPPGTASATATSTANVTVAPPVATVPTLDPLALAALALALAGAAMGMLATCR